MLKKMKNYLKPFLIVLLLILIQLTWDMMLIEKSTHYCNVSYYKSDIGADMNKHQSIYTNVSGNKSPVLSTGRYFLQVNSLIADMEQDLILNFNNHNIENVYVSKLINGKLEDIEAVNFNEYSLTSGFPSYILMTSQGQDNFLFHFDVIKPAVLTVSVKTKRSYIKIQLARTLLRGGLYVLILLLSILSFRNYVLHKQKVFILRAVLNLLYLSLMLYYDDVWMVFVDNNDILGYAATVMYIALCHIVGYAYPKELLTVINAKKQKNTVALYASNIGMVLFICYLVSQTLVFYYIALCFVSVAVVFSLYYIIKDRMPYEANSFYVWPTIICMSVFTIYLTQMLLNFNIVLVSTLLIKICLFYEISMGYSMEKYLINENLVSRVHLWQIIKHKFKKRLSKNQDDGIFYEETDTDVKILSRREVQIAYLIADKKKNTEISEKLFISINTVKFHRRNIYKKLGVTNQQDLQRIIENISR